MSKINGTIFLISPATILKWSCQYRHLFLISVITLLACFPMLFVQAMEAKGANELPDVGFILILEKNQVKSTEPLKGELIIQNNGDKAVKIISAKSTYIKNIEQVINISIIAHGSETFDLDFVGLSNRTTEITLVITYSSLDGQVLSRGVASAPIKVLNRLGFDFDPLWPLLIGSALTLVTTYILNIISFANERSKSQRNAIGHLKTFCKSVLNYIKDFEIIPVEFWKKIFLEGQTLLDVREKEKKKGLIGIDSSVVELLVLSDKYNLMVREGSRDKQDVRIFLASFEKKANELLKKISKIE